MRRALVLAAPLGLLLSTSPVAEEAFPLALTHVTLVDVARATAKADMTIVIAGELIAAIGRTADVKVPAHAQVVDATGKWVIPGLIDMHAHGSAKGDLPLALYLVNGVTSIRDMAGDVTLLRLARQELEAGKRPGPRLFFAGPALDGNPPVWAGDTILADSPERAESAVHFLVDQGVDLIKVYNNVTEPVLKAIVRTAQKRGVPVTGHVPRSMTMTRAVETGMDGLEHIRITGRELLPLDLANTIDFLTYTQREPLLWKNFALDSAGMKRLVSLLSERKVFLTPTLLFEQEVFVARRGAASSDPNNRFLPRRLREEEEREQNAEIFVVPPALYEAAIASYAKRAAFVRMCAEAGVIIVAGSDGIGLGKLLPGFGLHHELEALVAAGLKPAQALQAATINAALALRKDKELGSIEVGKLADLVLLNADPLREIGNAARIDAVVANGRLLERTWIDGMLAEMEAAGRK